MISPTTLPIPAKRSSSVAHRADTRNVSEVFPKHLCGGHNFVSVTNNVVYDNDHNVCQQYVAATIVLV